jgi:hypothetical protein
LARGQLRISCVWRPDANWIASDYFRGRNDYPLGSVGCPHELASGVRPIDVACARVDPKDGSMAELLTCGLGWCRKATVRPFGPFCSTNRRSQGENE